MQLFSANFSVLSRLQIRKNAEKNAGFDFILDFSAYLGIIGMSEKMGSRFRVEDD